MNDKKNEAPQVDVKLPVETVAAILNFGVAELAGFIYIDKSQVPDSARFGEWAAQQLLSGKSVRFYDSDAPAGTKNARYCDMTMEMLLDGVKTYLDAGLMFLLDDDGTLDAEFIEAMDSIPILSMAMLGGWSEMGGASDDIL